VASKACLPLHCPEGTGGESGDGGENTQCPSPKPGQPTGDHKQRANQFDDDCRGRPCPAGVEAKMLLLGNRRGEAGELDDPAQQKALVNPRRASSQVQRHSNIASTQEGSFFTPPSMRIPVLPRRTSDPMAGRLADKARAWSCPCTLQVCAHAQLAKTVLEIAAGAPQAA